MISNNPFGTCRNCGNRVLWIQTRAGRNMPCNPEIVTYFKRDGAKEKIVTPDGDVVSGDIVSPDAVETTGIGYISHFATCPNADRHRRK